MSGIRLHSYRQGDRSEYLAQYLMSGLGLVTQVPRQEDIGFDLHCMIADQESGPLTFGFPFLLQVKTASDDAINFGTVSKKGEWQHEGIGWLLRQEVPLFVGLVTRSENRIDVYHTSALWFIWREYPTRSQILLKPRRDFTNTANVDKPSREKLADWPAEGAGDGYSYTVDLGLPVISFSTADLDNVELVKTIKGSLRAAVALEQRNVVFKELSLPYFNWIFTSEINGWIQPAWSYYQTSATHTPVLLDSIARPAISLALNLAACKRVEDLARLKEVLKLLPAGAIPQALRDNHPEIFDW